MFISILHSGLTQDFMESLITAYSQENLDGVVRFKTIPAEHLLGLNLPSAISDYGMYLTTFGHPNDIRGQFKLMNYLPVCTDMLNEFLRVRLHSRVTVAINAMNAADENESSATAYIKANVNHGNVYAHILSIMAMFGKLEDVAYEKFEYESVPIAIAHYPYCHLMSSYAGGYLGGMQEAKDEQKETHRKNMMSKLTVIDGGK